MIIHILMVPCQWVFAKVGNNNMECKQVPSMRSGEAIRGIGPKRRENSNKLIIYHSNSFTKQKSCMVKRARGGNSCKSS